MCGGILERRVRSVPVKWDEILKSWLASWEKVVRLGNLCWDWSLDYMQDSGSRVWMQIRTRGTRRGGRGWRETLTRSVVPFSIISNEHPIAITLVTVGAVVKINDRA